MSLQRQRRFSVRIGGEDTGVWDKKGGGSVDSSEKVYYPGGMEDPISLGGKQEHENLTFERLFSLSRDLPKIKGWMALAGTGVAVVATELFLDSKKNVVSEGLVYRGTLKKVAPPDHDSGSDDEAMVAAEATITSIS
jgi:hypothetical protein